MKKTKVGKKPFFAKLLEDQKVDQIKDLKGGGPRYVTHKYPSDNDEDGGILY